MPTRRKTRNPDRPIVLDNHAILYPGPHDQSLTLNDIAGPRGPGPGAHESWFKLYVAAWLERVWTFLQYGWIILKLRCGFVKVTRKIFFRQFSNLQNFNQGYRLLDSRSPASKQNGGI